MSKSISRFLGTAVLGISLSMSTSLLFISDAIASQTALVKGSIVNVRSGPGITYSKISTVKSGARFTVLDQKNGWYKLMVSKNVSGWVTGDYLSVTGPMNTGPVKDTTPAAAPVNSGQASGKTGIVTGQVVNLRSGPGTGYGLVGKTQKGQQYSVAAESSGWYKLNLPGGKTGWIIGQYFKVNPVSGTGSPVSKPAAPSAKPGSYVIIREAVVNVRSGAGTNYSVLTKVKAQEKYPVIQSKGGWYQIILPNQKQGWVAGWIVDLRSESSPSRDDTGITEPPAGGEAGADTGGTSGTGDGGAAGGTSGGTAGSSDQGAGQQPADTASSAKISDVRFEKGDNGEEKIVVTGDAPLEYNLFSVSDPLRLVIDIKNSVADNLKDVQVDGDLTSKVRVAQYSLSPNTVRIVVELNQAVDFTPVLEQNGKSLTVTVSKPTIAGKVIVIDAGHGEYDPGAIGVTGLQEKDFNLAAALLLRDKLNSLGATVILTRDEDKFISLSERCEIANDAKADIFVAIHANSSVTPSLQGTSTYFYAPSGNAKLYAQADQRKKLATSVQNHLIDLLGTRNIGVLQENFAVLRGTDMPSILVESAFVSNVSDEAHLKDNAFREEIAQAIADGLVEYFENK